ncbi:MAG: hypothetical protein IJW81_06940 [Clostridia bacterium]|nr:hypothetical protein [Clostridia bacterium]
MDYSALKQKTNTGWNTWNTLNVLSYSHLPEGFTINLCIREYSDARVLRESLIGRYGNNDEKIIPGARSYDGSCTQMELHFHGLTLDVKTVVDEDEQIILLTPESGSCYRTPTLIIEACLMWGKDGGIFRKDGRIYGECGGRRFDIYTTSPTVNEQHTHSLSPYIAVTLDRPVVVSTRPCTIEEAEALYAAAKARLDIENQSFGEHSEAYTAMKTCLAWDTIYECEHDRVCSPVSRIWNVGWGGYVLFDWDTYFAALMASLENKELAQLNAIAITDEVTPAGFIPNFGCNHNGKSYDRSQPPVGSFVCLEIYKRHPERWFAEHVFPALLEWNRWFAGHRMTDEGYLCWGSDPFEPIHGRFWELNSVHDTAGAALESGLDNSPMYDGMDFDPERNIMLLADVGLMGLYILDCRSLIELAKIVGQEEVIPELEARKAHVEAAMATLWDDEFGFFLNKDLRDGSFSKRISPTNFYALHADCVTETQKRRMMDEHFYNPDEFWGDYIIPTIARNDPAFPDQTYWRGRIWAPTNYLAYIAMKHAGLKKECADLADKSEELLLKEWRLHGHVHENYSGIDGMGCGVNNSDKFYHWGGLLAYIAIDNAESCGQM